MRYLTREIERLLREEKRMAFIAGPRQVGKTTLARALLESSSPGNYFNWDNDAQRKAVLKKPDSFSSRRSSRRTRSIPPSPTSRSA